MCACVLQIHNQLQAQFSNLNDDFVRLQMDLDEQTEANARLQAELAKAGTDTQQLKAKHEKDITIITEELEDTKSVFSENHTARAATDELRRRPLNKYHADETL